MIAFSIAGSLLLLSDCAQPVANDPREAPNGYAGPLFLPRSDYKSSADRATGAAGRVVACRSSITGSVDAPDAPHAGAPARTPGAALRLGWSEGLFYGVQTGLLLDRQDADRALFTYRVDGKVKQAVIVHHGPTLDRGGKVGWYVESWARCDLSEFDMEPPQMAGIRIQIWRDEHGVAVPTDVVSSYRGAEHCDWSRMTFLRLHDVTYVEQPDPAYRDEYFADPYRRDIPLPSDAVDTGYHRGEDHLWRARDNRWAYVGQPDRVDAWPREMKPLVCA